MSVKSILEKRKRSKLLDSAPEIRGLAEVLLADAIAPVIEEFKERMEKLANKFENSSQKTEDVFRKGVDKIQNDLDKKGDKGDKGDKGIDGQHGLNAKEVNISGIVSEIVDIVSKRIRQPEDGKDALIDIPLIVSETLKRIPEQKVVSVDDVVSKLNSSNRLELRAIKGFAEILKNLKRSVKETRRLGGGGGGGGMGNFVNQQFDGDGATTQFTLSNEVANGGNAVIACRYEGQIQYLGDQFTISGKTLTMTFTPENNTKIEITYIRS